MKKRDKFGLFVNMVLAIALLSIFVFPLGNIKADGIYITPQPIGTFTTPLPRPTVSATPIIVWTPMPTTVHPTPEPYPGPYPGPGDQPSAVPFIYDINNGVLTVWYPNKIYYMGNGTIWITNVATQEHYAVPLMYHRPGGADGAGIYLSGVPKTDGVYDVDSGTMSDGQEISGIPTIFSYTAYHMFIPMVMR